MTDSSSSVSNSYSFDDLLAESGASDQGRSGGRKPRRPLLKSFRFWVPVGILLLVVVLAVAALVIAKDVWDRAQIARDSLSGAVPLVSELEQQIVARDSDAAAATAAELQLLTAEAVDAASGFSWSVAEAVPVIGANLSAVRAAGAVANDLTAEALVPLASVGFDAIKPVDGRIDPAGVAELAVVFEGAAASVVEAQRTMSAINTADLLPQVSEGVVRVADLLDETAPSVEAAAQALSILPAALGADGVRNYLVLVQNNAESRGTGGNPAALVMLTVDDGRLSITQQASSGDFKYNRPEPIIELDPQTEALYGDKIGRYMQDVTLTPDFSESAEIMSAFWAESFGTPVDATVSIDPVALSYLLAATGPVQLATGETMTADNAVQLLLSDVYRNYEDPAMQDAFFAAAAAEVFGALLSADDEFALIEQLSRGVNEGRILYVPADDAELELLAGSRALGVYPSENVEATVMGAYVNDITEGKLNFYMDTAVSVASNVCDAGAVSDFELSLTLASTLQPDQVWSLPSYVSPARFFPKGVISTDVVLYGPAGAEFVSASVDGAAVSVSPLEHLGRPAVKVNVVNQPGSSHVVAATFTSAGEHGPVEVWHTPMVGDTEVTVPLCE